MSTKITQGNKWMSNINVFLYHTMYVKYNVGKIIPFNKLKGHISFFINKLVSINHLIFYTIHLNLQVICRSQPLVLMVVVLNEGSL